jgi:hypothetical protein
MTRKFLVIILICFSFLFISPRLISAQDLVVPGATCGIPIMPGVTPEANNSCCIQEIGKIPSIPLLGYMRGWPVIGVAVDGLVTLYDHLSNYNDKIRGQYQTPKCMAGSPEGEGSDCVCKITDKEQNLPYIGELCRKYLSDSTEMAKCETCAKTGGYWSGLACIPLGTRAFVNKFVQISISLAGGIALLCIIYCAIQMQISRGNPQRLEKARENLISCITGLLLILFSVFILQAVGVKIFGIPGFG